MNKKVIAFTVSDNNNLRYYEMLKKSWEKFHPDIELRLYGEKEIREYDDPQFFYRATPIIASALIRDYDTVLKMDADQILLDNISEILDVDADVGVVRNDPTYLAGQVWDITHPNYYNNGLVVIKSKEFVDHWKALCLSPHFNVYQHREQDILNILTSDYLNYNVFCLEDGDFIYGEWAKPLWAKCKMEGNKVILPDKKQLKVIHFSGGQASPDKGNYRLRFQKDVAKYIDSLVK